MKIIKEAAPQMKVNKKGKDSKQHSIRSLEAFKDDMGSSGFNRANIEKVKKMIMQIKKMTVS